MSTPAYQPSIEELREAVLSRFSTFCMLMQDDGWFDPIHEQICDQIQEHLEHTGVLKALREGIDVGTFTADIGIVMPRGSLKSTIITKLFSVWLSLQDPNIRILIVGNTAPNAAKKLDDIRGLWDTNDLLRAMFPNLLPTRAQSWTGLAAELNRSKSFPEATYESAGTKTKVTGRHFNVTLQDDTVAPEKDEMQEEVVLPSRESLEQAIGWHKSSYPLLVPKGVRIRIVVSTRWADDDLIFHIRNKERGWFIVDIPATKDGTEDGEPNFTMFYSKQELQQIKENIGSYMFSCLYLNNPLPPGSRLFSAAHFQSYTDDQIPAEAGYYISIDPAISEKEKACETAIIGSFQFYSFLFVHDIVHKRMNPFELISTALDLAERRMDRVKGIILETVAFQKSLVYFLLDEMRRREIYIPIIENPTRTAKDMRIAALQPLYENHQIFHRRGLDPILESQLAQYPHGKLIDVVDALASQLFVYRGLKHKPKVAQSLQSEEGSLWQALQGIRSKKEGCGLFARSYDLCGSQAVFGRN